MPAKSTRKKTRRGANRPAPTNAAALRLARQLGAVGPKIVNPARIETAPWVRWKCRYGCGGYGQCLTCPPNSPTPQETREVLDSYRRAILFEAPRGQLKKLVVALERELFLAGAYKAFGMGAGPCGLCAKCAFEAGCRHPDQARPCMEACGIDVYATARRHGFTINVVRNEADPQHYFGMVLVD